MADGQIKGAAILDERKSLSIAFRAISDQYANRFFLNLFTKWLPAAILDYRKSDQYATFIVFECFHKMAAGGHCGSPISAKNNRVLTLCVYTMNLIGVFVIKLWPVHALACGGSGGDSGGGATKNIIPPKFENFGDIINIYIQNIVMSYVPSGSCEVMGVTGYFSVMWCFDG